MIAMAADGSVSPFKGYGPWLVLLHGDSGKFHLLGHLDPADRQRAPIGLRVAAGTPIGKTSAANHTHWEVRTKMVPDFAHGETNITNNTSPIAWLSSGGIGTLTVLMIAGAGLLWWLSQRHTTRAP